MTLYQIVLTTHITSVALSLSFFMLRGLWMIQEHALLQKKLVRVLPHIIDTTLLVAAIMLAIITQQYPLEQTWLTVKVIALFVYIALGMVALKRGRTKSHRVIALVLALATFAFMLSVAATRDPLGFLVFLAFVAT